MIDMSSLEDEDDQFAESWPILWHLEYSIEISGFGSRLESSAKG